MGITNTTNDAQRDLLVAKSAYHSAKNLLLCEQIKLIDAVTAHADALSNSKDNSESLNALKQTVHMCEDQVTMAEAKVAVASSAVGRLLAIKRERVAGHITDLLFGAGDRLIDLVGVDFIDPDDVLHRRVPWASIPDLLEAGIHTVFDLGNKDGRSRRRNDSSL